MYQEIVEILNREKVSAEDMVLWRVILDTLPENLQKNILEAITENPETVHNLTANMKEKKRAIENQDVVAWENILKSERASLTEI